MFFIKLIEGTGNCEFLLTRLSGILIVILLNLLFLEMKIKSICQLVDTFVEQMSHVMRKPRFWVCKNKGADQLHGNPEDDQRPLFSLHG